MIQAAFSSYFATVEGIQYTAPSTNLRASWREDVRAFP